MIVAFSVMFILMGYVGVYGFADGLVLSTLTMFFGSIGGTVGSGAVLCIAIMASFSFLLCHVVKSIIKKRSGIRNMAGPFIPHILIGYGSVCVAIFSRLLI